MATKICCHACSEDFYSQYTLVAKTCEVSNCVGDGGATALKSHASFEACGACHGRSGALLCAGLRPSRDTAFRFFLSMWLYKGTTEHGRPHPSLFQVSRQRVAPILFCRARASTGLELAFTPSFWDALWLGVQPLLCLLAECCKITNVCNAFHRTSVPRCL